MTAQLEYQIIIIKVFVYTNIVDGYVFLQSSRYFVNTIIKIICSDVIPEGTLNEITAWHNFNTWKINHITCIVAINIM